MIECSIEELLERDGRILRLPVGDSMWPMLKNREDQIVIEKINRPLKVNDVVLFKRDNGQYVLHRLVRFRKGAYVFRGDNQTFNEYGITDRHVLGVLVGFYRGNRYIDCETDKKYKKYVKNMRWKYLLKQPYRRFCVLSSKVKRRIIKSKR